MRNAKTNRGDILIVDDQPNNLKILASILEQHGYKVRPALSGELALTAVRESFPGIILLDILMPGMDGFEVCKQLKADEKTRHIPIIFISALEDISHKMKAFAAGGVDYITKPFEEEEVLARTEIHLKLRRMELSLIENNIQLQQEITERKEVEKALRDSEEKYRSMMEAMNDPAYICSPDFHVEYMNPAMVKRAGRDAVGEPCHKVIHELDDKCPWCVHDKMQQGENGVSEIVSPKDNRTYNVSRSPIHHLNGSISQMAIYRDVTEQKNMEQKLQQATKMEAIATLAGGVAHEFNNALMGVMGNLELFRMDLPADERTDKYFEAMNESGHRMSRLTDQLLAYAQGGQYEPRNLKLDDFTIETLPILQHDLRPEIRVETHFPKDISYIRADHAQMQMVLTAILANANEAIEDEGLIKITAGNKDIDEDSIEQHPGLKPGPYVYLNIEDDGGGMDEETKNGIFEPFFTTKFQGRGMGMAAVYGIVKSHDGAITVDSEPGKGTVVSIYLPAIEVKEEVKKVKQPETEIAMGEGTILIIEDEEPLVEIFRQILERLGYRVLQAMTGKQAVEFAKSFDGQIDLALLDIKLPDMDGGRVYPLIMEARPDMKVIVCSGYSIDGPAQAILDAGAEGFIQKPFSIAPFAEKLKDVLEGK